MGANRQKINVEKTVESWVSASLSQLKKRGINNENFELESDSPQQAFNQLIHQVGKNVRSLSAGEILNCYYQIERVESESFRKQGGEPLTDFLYVMLKEIILQDLVCREQGVTIEEYPDILTNPQSTTCFQNIQNFIAAKDAALKKLEAVMKYSDELSPILNYLHLPESEKQQAFNEMLSILEEQKTKASNKKPYEKALAFFKDYIQISNLNMIDIKTDDHKVELSVALSQSFGRLGLTHDITLLDLPEVITNLNRINQAEFITVTNYLEHKQDYTLTETAVLQLPSRKMFTVDLQREHIKRQIAKILKSEQETEMKSVNYHGKPGLLYKGNLKSLKQSRDHGGSEVSIEQRIKSLIDPIASQQKIKTFMDDVIKQHHDKIKKLTTTLAGPQGKTLTKTSLRNEKIKELKRTKLLLEDARKMQNDFTINLSETFNHLPPVKIENKEITADDLANLKIRKQYEDVFIHALRLEKMANTPIFFDEAGKPYKFPKAKHRDKFITEIDIQGDNVTLIFNKSFHSITLNTEIKNKLLTLSKSKLFQFDEKLLLGEFNPQAQYLNLPFLNHIKDSYESGYRGKTIDIIKAYLKAAPTVTAMKNAMTSFNDLIAQAKTEKGHLGFIMHIRRYLQFAIQKDLQKLMNEHIEIVNNLPDIEQMTKAFNAAIKLEKIDEFNGVVMHYLENNIIATKDFADYLNRTIQYANEANDHQDELKLKSEAMGHDSNQMINAISDKIMIDKFLKKPNDPNNRSLFYKVLDRVKNEACDQANRLGIDMMAIMQNLFYERCKGIDLDFSQIDDADNGLQKIKNKIVKNDAEEALLMVIEEIKQKKDEQNRKKIYKHEVLEIEDAIGKLDRIKTLDPASHQLLIRTLQHFGFKLPYREPSNETFGVNKQSFSNEEAFNHLQPFVQLLLSHKINDEDINEYVNTLVDKNVNNTTKKMFKDIIIKEHAFQAVLTSNSFKNSLVNLDKMLLAIKSLFPEMPNVNKYCKLVYQLIQKIERREALLSDIKKTFQEMKVIQDWISSKVLSHFMADMIADEMSQVAETFLDEANKFENISSFTSLNDFILPVVDDTPENTIKNIVRDVLVDENKDLNELNLNLGFSDVHKLEIANFKARLLPTDKIEADIQFIASNIANNIREIHALQGNKSEERVKQTEELVKKTRSIISELEDLLKFHQYEEAFINNKINMHLQALKAAPIWQANNQIKTPHEVDEILETFNVLLKNPSQNLFENIRALLINLLKTKGTEIDPTLTPSQFIQLHKEKLKTYLSNVYLEKETIHKFSQFWHDSKYAYEYDSAFGDYTTEFNFVYQLLQTNYRNKHHLRETKPKYRKLGERQLAEIAQGVNLSMDQEGVNEAPYDYARFSSKSRGGISFRVIDTNEAIDINKNTKDEINTQNILPLNIDHDMRAQIIDKKMAWVKVKPDDEIIRNARLGYEAALDGYAGNSQDCDFFLMKSNKDFSKIYNLPNYSRYSYVLTDEGLYFLDRDIGEHLIVANKNINDKSFLKKLREGLKIPGILPKEPMCYKKLNKKELDLINIYFSSFYSATADDKYMEIKNIIGPAGLNDPFYDMRAQIKYSGGQAMELPIRDYLLKYKGVGILDKKTLAANNIDFTIKYGKCFFREENDASGNRLKFYQKIMIPELTVSHAEDRENNEIIKINGRFGETYLATESYEQRNGEQAKFEDENYYDHLYELNIVGYFSFDKNGKPKATITEATFIDFTDDLLEFTDEFKNDTKIIHHPDIFMRLSNVLHFLAGEIYACKDEKLRDKFKVMHQKLKTDEQYFRTRLEVTSDDRKIDFYNELHKQLNFRVQEFGEIVKEKVETFAGILVYDSPKLREIYSNIRTQEHDATVDLNKLKAIDDIQILTQSLYEGLRIPNDDRPGEWAQALFEATCRWMNDSRNKIDSKMGREIEKLRNACAYVLINLKWVNENVINEKLAKIQDDLEKYPAHKHMTGIENMRDIFKKVAEDEETPTKIKEHPFITLLKLQKCAIERKNQAWPFGMWSERGREEWAKKIYDEMTDNDKTTTPYFSNIIDKEISKNQIDAHELKKGNSHNKLSIS